ncbi:MAG: serine/threonine-protein kinase [Myxococcota bacterium]
MSQVHDLSDRFEGSGPYDETRSLGLEVSESSGGKSVRAVDQSDRLDSFALELCSPGPDDPRAGTAPEQLAAGEMIGRFMVLGTLGQGGMGTVYEAFDRSLDRRVAVKVLRSDMDPRYQQRLLREAQALAQLSHPNVVQVYEVGEYEGQGFVTMELVRGRTLRQWRKQESPPGWQACVEVYLQAGAGLAAAHEQGLVHCDFKPSNAIVDEEGRVRVLDFGLVRITNDTSLDMPPEPVGPTPARFGSRSRISGSRSTSDPTHTGTVMGTPAYMSPEQMRGRPVDARGDQFSFCVSLYEAAYGERPFVRRSRGALADASAEEQVVPAPRNTSVPTALREILLRGLAPEPKQRWPSMQALLDELRPLVVPRRRVHLLALSGALVLGLALVGAGLAYQAEVGQRCSGAVAQLDGVWDDTRRQRVADAILGTQLSYASDTWVRVKAGLDDYAQAWADKYTEVCEATSLRQEQSPEMMDRRMGCLQERRVALREAVGVLSDSDSNRVERAVSLVESLPPLLRCDDLHALQADVPPPADPQVAERVEVLRGRLAQVRALREAGVYDEALVEAEVVVERAEGLGYAPLLAEAWFSRGGARREVAQYEQAEQDLERAYLLAAEHEHHALEAKAVRELIFVVGHDQAKHEAGLQWGKVALAQARGSRAQPLDEALALSAVGVVRWRQGELDQALAHLRPALETFIDVLGPRHSTVAYSLHNIGTVQWNQGKPDEALPPLRRALAIREETLGPRHPSVATSLTAIGAILQGPQKLEHFRRALAIREEALGARHPDVATSLNNIGTVLKEQGEWKEALAHFERALGIMEEALGASHPRVAYPLNNIGEVLRAQQRGDDALPYLRRALSIFEQALGSEHPDVAVSMTNLGNLLYHQQAYEDAALHYQRALKILQEVLPADHPHQAWPILGLAKVGLVQGRFEEAREYAERALVIRDKAGVAAELLAEVRFMLARALWNEGGERLRARALAEQAHDAWASADADDEHTREYLAEVRQWLTQHPVL